MTKLNKAYVEDVLSSWEDPYLESNLLDAKAVKEITAENGQVAVTIVLGFPADGYVAKMQAELKTHLEQDDLIDQATLNISWKVASHKVQKGVKQIPGIKNIIAVASGKGGVGKSTTAVNLALALSAEGATVGILDADIYGPSIPRMLGVSTKPESLDGKTLEPVVSYHVQSMSIGYLIEEETPMIWRGPMVTQALEQLIGDTRWKDVDYLVIDLPPGTGDTQLTLAQKIPVSGAVIVTTPQDIALLDARRGLKMFEKVEVPVLGVVENMGLHICSSCGHEEHIFGQGGGERMSDEHEVDFLGSLPLESRIRADVDEGKPTVVSEPEGRVAQIYRDIARRAAAKLSRQGKEYASVFPSISITN